jgi:signal transduction histidine kinase
MMTNAQLLDLAPVRLPNYRKRRYLGDDLCLPMAEFTAADAERIRNLYAFLEEMFALVGRDTDFAPEKLARVSAFIDQQDVSAWIRSVQAFGSESYAAAPTELMAKTIHDLRGGGLTMLLNRLQFMQLGDEVNAEAIRSLFFLTRDHLKMMRNALLGLDDPKREEDLLPKLHGIDLVVEKWKDATLHAHQRQIRLEVESHFRGNISECCVEFGALDRILYNLMNNACRHTSAAQIRLSIAALPEERDLRFVLANPISPADEAALSKRELRELFQPGVSSTGSGFGMTVAADFVANAYGLSSRNKAVEKAYLGAKVVEHQFTAWFHWPIAPDI